MRKVLVGANSPSLWPTIDSEMYTGTCLRPSCTAMVWPTMSGMIVERRDQVRITRLSRLRFSSSIFLSRWSSTNGPFFRLRAMSAAPSLAAAAAGLAPADQLLLGVADLADGGPAGGLHLADLARRHPQRRQLALLGEELDARPGGAAELGAATRPQLQVVDDRADRDVLEGQGVARLDVGALAGLHRVADPEAGGRDDVALVAVGVVEQRDAGGAVGVVLDRGHACGHAVLVPAEVDDPVALLVAPTLVAGGDAAVDV